MVLELLATTLLLGAYAPRLVQNLPLDSDRDEVAVPNGRYYFMTQAKKDSLYWEGVDLWLSDTQPPQDLLDGEQYMIVPYFVDVQQVGYSTYSVLRVGYYYSNVSHALENFHRLTSSSSSYYYDFGFASPWALCITNDYVYAYGVNAFDSTYPYSSWEIDFTTQGSHWGYEDSCRRCSNGSMYHQDPTDFYYPTERWVQQNLPVLAKLPYDTGFVQGGNDGGQYTQGYNQGYEDGRTNGYTAGYNDAQSDLAQDGAQIANLFGAVVSVPIEVLNGLAPFAIWNIPILSIIITFLFLALVLWIVKRFV